MNTNACFSFSSVVLSNPYCPNTLFSPTLISNTYPLLTAFLSSFILLGNIFITHNRFEFSSLLNLTSNAFPQNGTLPNPFTTKGFHIGPAETPETATASSGTNLDAHITHHHIFVTAGRFQMSKVVFIGKSNAGKTSLVTRVTENRFDNNTRPTTSTAHFSFKPDESDPDLEITFWDTAGMEKYRAINQIYYREAVGAILVFDLTARDSFEELDMWKGDFLAGDPQPNAILILAGNKCDLGSPVVTEEEARTWAEDNGVLYFQVSAKTGEGVAELVDALVKTIPRKCSEPEERIVPLEDPPEKQKKDGCC